MQKEYLYILLAFFLGSIPFAFLYGKIFHGIDIRHFGSGNSGATNSLRVLGKTAGIVVLILDCLKGFLPIFFLKNNLEPHWLIFIGLASILGHVFSPFLGFKGGKGIATSLGVILSTNPYLGLICLGIFIFMVYFFRIVSLGSLIAGLAYFLVNLYRLGLTDSYTILSLGLLLLVIYTHKTNILLLLQNKERKI
jgi:acyl phosphate:glycerol-3-phosphate acyltransferase